MSEGPGPIRRHSSRRGRLDESLLLPRLRGAKAYDRIAGYFTSSILEVAGEALEAVEGPIRLICNSVLDVRDIETARAAQEAIRREWCASRPEDLADAGGATARTRFVRLHDFLRTGKLQVRVLPDRHFGLIHGKAGVITLADGSKTAFLGSANESRTGWTLNYELVWEDSSPEGVRWVEEEFNALWKSPFAIPLAEFVVEDIGRLSRRTVIDSVSGWVAASEGHAPDPASVFVEAPVYRKNSGLWAHQKVFVKLVFDAHRLNPGGARFVLADQVGLGKTVQLAMAAELMALTGNLPVLILAPKTLLWQWQTEMLDLLDVPSAVWNGRQWVDERGIEYPDAGVEEVRRCPRRIGIVSTGLVTRGSQAAEHLAAMEFECVVLDEAHRARRRNLGAGREDEHPDANNLLAFLYRISPRTKSLLLATATPVQLYPVEAWDLLDALGRRSEAVLGSRYSRWRRPGDALDLIRGRGPLPTDDIEKWEWVRDPLPPKGEHRDFEALRRSLGMDDSQVAARGDDWLKLGPADRQRLDRLFPRFVERHNPIIRHIVRRTRKYLEETTDPETGEPFLRKIEVVLHGESEDDAVRLPPYLSEAYDLAEEFCRLLAGRMQGSGFLKTLLLRRTGSTMAAGRATAEKLLATWQDPDFAEEDEDEESEDRPHEREVGRGPAGRTLTASERQLLQRFIAALQANQDRDPKYGVVLECLVRRRWLDKGCIVFSQYWDSIHWLGEQLSEEFPEERLGLYAGAGRSGITRGGQFVRVGRDEIKAGVQRGETRLLLGTDAASEGLNLQRLGTLINLDLPWNPTRLEQRKGRIQRIGQVRDAVDIYNMRYRGSVEDRVHQLLSARLQEIYDLFGQLPDILEDAWIHAALGDIERAKRIIDAVPRQHPFELRYHTVERIEWESCERVLSATSRREALEKGW